MIAPILGEIASEQDELTIAKINIDDHPQASMKFGVQSIPTLLVFRDGVVAKRIVGARGKGQLLQELSEFLGSH
jgi:thioredoxin 1